MLFSSFLSFLLKVLYISINNLEVVIKIISDNIFCSNQKNKIRLISLEKYFFKFYSFTEFKN